jgi:hypothetical protein
MSSLFDLHTIRCLFLLSVQVKRANTVEVGRLVQFNYGCQSGKVAVIVDIVDQSRVSCSRYFCEVLFVSKIVWVMSS